LQPFDQGLRDLPRLLDCGQMATVGHDDKGVPGTPLIAFSWQMNASRPVSPAISCTSRRNF
jgi:hypothetical protein